MHSSPEQHIEYERRHDRQDADHRPARRRRRRVALARQAHRPARRCAECPRPRPSRACSRFLPLHGIGGAKDLPDPARARDRRARSAALVVSFCVLALAWRTPRYEGPRPGRPVPGGSQTGRRRRAASSGPCGSLGLLFFALPHLGPDLGPGPGHQPGARHLLRAGLGRHRAGLAAVRAGRAAVSPVRTLNLLLAKATGGDPATGLWRRTPRGSGYWPAARRAVRLRLAGAGQPAERLPRLGAAVAGGRTSPSC